MQPPKPPAPRAARRAAGLALGAVLALLLALAAPGAPAALAAPSAPAQTTPAAAEPCPTLDGPVTLGSVAETSTRLEGTWLLCNGSSIFGATGTGEVGFQVLDGRFYRVYQDSAGGLVRQSGADQEGTLSVIDTTAVNGPGSYQVNFAVLGRGTVITIPKFYSQPDAVRLPGAAALADYRRWTGAAPTPAPPPATESCASLQGPVTLTSVAQTASRIEGTWLLCGGTSPFGTPASGEVGFQVVNGRFYRVYRNASGALVQGSGTGQVGTVSVLDMTAANGPGSYQVNVQFDGDGTVITLPVFFSRPDAVRLPSTFATGDYQRWTGAAPATPGDNGGHQPPPRPGHGHHRHHWIRHPRPPHRLVVAVRHVVRSASAPKAGRG